MNFLYLPNEVREVCHPVEKRGPIRIGRPTSDH
jgi:hypothetical protein